MKGGEDKAPAGQGITEQDIDELFAEVSGGHPDADIHDMKRHAKNNSHNGGEKAMPTQEQQKKDTAEREGVGKTFDELSERLRIGRRVQEAFVGDPTAAALMLAGDTVLFDVKRLGIATDVVIQEVLDFYSSIRQHIVAFKIVEKFETHYVVQMTVCPMDEVIEVVNATAPQNEGPIFTGPGGDLVVVSQTSEAGTGSG